jgi:hypothetical protein
MKVTGYKLRQAIKEMETARDLLAARFADCLKEFEGEEKPDPIDVMKLYEAAEKDLASLQTAQTQYNVLVRVPGLGILLSEAIKQVGGAGRVEKMWKVVATGPKNRYGFESDSRSKDMIVAKLKVSAESAGGLAKRAGKWASSLREAIQLGNAIEVDIEGLDPELFE